MEWLNLAVLAVGITKQLDLLKLAVPGLAQTKELELLKLPLSQELET